MLVHVNSGLLGLFYIMSGFFTLIHVRWGYIWYCQVR